MPANNLIYIADDKADYRFVLQQLFRHYLPVYSLILFEGGQALLNKLWEGGSKPALIILDRHMPHLDGQQTLVLLKGDPTYKRIPVVMMSSEASSNEIKDGYEAGANSFLKKELDLQSMKQTLETVCYYWLETNQQPIEN